MCSSSSLPSLERCWTNVPTGQCGAISSCWLSSVIAGLSASPQASQYILTEEQDEHSHTHTYIQKWEGSRQAREESHSTGYAGLTVWDRTWPSVWHRCFHTCAVCLAAEWVAQLYLYCFVTWDSFWMTEFGGWTHWSPEVPSNACGSVNFILVSFIFWFFLHLLRLCAKCPIFCRWIHSENVMNMNKVIHS